MIIALRVKIIGVENTTEKLKKNEKMLSFFCFIIKMITTTNYNSQKISLGSLQNKKSRLGKKYQNIPILYDGRKAIVYLCGRFRLLPGPSFYTSPENNNLVDETGITDYAPDGYSVALEVDADNRKLFEDFEKKIHSEVVESEQTKIKEWWGEGVKLIKECDRVYLKIYFDGSSSRIEELWSRFSISPKNQR